MIRALYLDEAKRMQTADAPDSELLRRMKQKSSVLWVDMEHPTPEEENAVLRDIFRFHELSIEDTYNENHHPKLDEFEDHLFIITNGIPDLYEGEFFNERRTFTFIGENFLVTVHRHKSVAAQRVFEQCVQHPAYAQKGPDHIYHLILDIATDQYLAALDIINEEMEALEDKVFLQPDNALLNDIINEKRQILAFHKTSRHQKEILNKLSNESFKLITKKERMYYRNVYDHLMRVTDAIEFYREQANGLLSVYLSVSSNRMNEVMKVLTIIATIILPLTLIAGIYGMNFHVMPEISWEFGYPMALGMMAVVTIAFLWYFRRKRWL